MRRGKHTGPVDGHDGNDLVVESDFEVEDCNGSLMSSMEIEKMHKVEDIN